MHAMHRSQILGAAVDHLRQMYRQGASPAELESFLKARSGDDYLSLAPTYLGDAFLRDQMFLWWMGQPEHIKRWLIEDHRSDWERHEVPHLMRLRDYFSFMQFAQEEQVTVFVCGASPSSGRWIGKANVRCYAGRMLIPTSQLAPHEGLLAADPADPRLTELLARFDPPLSYPDYIERLGQQGFRVLPDDGHLVEDPRGNRLHDRYRLHAVCDSNGEESVWIQPRAERLRAALNRHLGAELVLFGPHDDWELRNDRKEAGPLWGPQMPVIEFGPDQEIRNRSSRSDYFSARWRQSQKGRWSQLYPHHPLEDAS